MAIDLKDISEQVHGLLTASGFTCEMYDSQGMNTPDPREATRFVASFTSYDPQQGDYSILVAVRDEFSRSYIQIESPPLPKGNDFNKVVRLAMLMRHSISQPNNLMVKWKKLNSKINLKDETVNNVTESRDIGKVFGSTKSSFQKVGNARLIIRHSDTVNEEVRGSRWRKIDKIFVENSQGERMRYPALHVAGARAMARHLANEGQFHDEIGEAIQGLSKDYTALKSSARMIRGVDALSEDVMKIREAMESVNNKVRRLSGPRGYTALSSTITEKSMELAANAIAEKVGQMMEACACQGNAHAQAAFETAARYTMSTMPSVEPAFEEDNDFSYDSVNMTEDDELVHIDEAIARLKTLGGF